MGVGPSTQAAQQAQAPGPVQASGCPVVQGRRGQQPQQPQQPRSPFGAFGGAPGAAESTCPVVRQGQGQGQGAQAQQQTGTQPPAVRQQPQEQEQAVYNVYSERIDPRNRVPIGTNRPGISPQQSVPLSTGRVTSTIPKGGTDATWTYPSPQMFYNALQRKGKGGDVKEQDVGDVVSVHNAMNERTWQAVLEYEQLHAGECGDPRLQRFEGRPFDLSPLARLYTLMGYEAPFDRHDWYVDRCGTAVRYIIDYYYDDAMEDAAKRGDKPSAAAMRMITVDARPALDSPGAAWDRVRKYLAGERTTDVALEAGATAAQAEAEAAPKSEGPAAAKMRQLHAECAECFSETQRCGDEATCLRAGAMLELCMARTVSPKQASQLGAAMERADAAKAKAAEEGVGGVTAWWRRRGAVSALRAEERARRAVQKEIEAFRAELRREVGA